MSEIPVKIISSILEEKHYLGPIKRGIAWQDEFGIAVFGHPTSRRIPQTWVELMRWCLNGIKNGGSQQWRKMVPWIKEKFPRATTVISYSDPSVGHTGSLYRACNWLWAPTWHRLRPPPTGNGNWGKKKKSHPKDRWVFLLKDDDERQQILKMKDMSVLKKYPWAEYREPLGADYKSFKVKLKSKGPMLSEDVDRCEASGGRMTAAAKNLPVELIQVAATAVAMVEAIERRENGEK